jgi:hypothetical protein
MKWLQGKKTYIAGGALMALALFSYWVGLIGDATAVIIFANGLGFCGIRSALANNHAVLLGELQR